MSFPLSGLESNWRTSPCQPPGCPSRCGSELPTTGRRASRALPAFTAERDGDRARGAHVVTGTTTGASPEAPARLARSLTTPCAERERGSGAGTVGRVVQSPSRARQHVADHLPLGAAKRARGQAGTRCTEFRTILRARRSLRILEFRNDDGRPSRSARRPPANLSEEEGCTRSERACQVFPFPSGRIRGKQEDEGRRGASLPQLPTTRAWCPLPQGPGSGGPHFVAFALTRRRATLAPPMRIRRGSRSC
jgi:hypothetical protein